MNDDPYTLMALSALGGDEDELQRRMRSDPMAALAKIMTVAGLAPLPVGGAALGAAAVGGRAALNARRAGQALKSSEAAVAKQSAQAEARAAREAAMRQRQEAMDEAGNVVDIKTVRKDPNGLPANRPMKKRDEEMQELYFRWPKNGAPSAERLRGDRVGYEYAAKRARQRLATGAAAGGAAGTAAEVQRRRRRK